MEGLFQMSLFFIFITIVGVFDRIGRSVAVSRRNLPKRSVQDLSSGKWMPLRRKAVITGLWSDEACLIGADKQNASPTPAKPGSPEQGKFP